PIGTPYTGIPVFRAARTNRQNFAFLIDQYLHMIDLRKAIQTSCIHIKLVVIEGHGRFTDMGKKFSAYYLISIIIEVPCDLQNIIRTVFFGRDGYMLVLNQSTCFVLLLCPFQRTEHPRDYPLCTFTGLLIHLDSSLPC